MSDFCPLKGPVMIFASIYSSYCRLMLAPERWYTLFMQILSNRECEVKTLKGDECLMTFLTPLTLLLYQPAGTDTIESCSACRACCPFTQDVCISPTSHCLHTHCTGWVSTFPTAAWSICLNHLSCNSQKSCEASGLLWPFSLCHIWF